MAVQDATNLDAAQSEATGLFRQVRGLRPGQDDDFEVFALTKFAHSERFPVNANLANQVAELIDYLTKTHSLGAHHFEGKDYHSFGTLTSKEWDMMFTKHLDHHLQQFGK